MRMFVHPLLVHASRHSTAPIALALRPAFALPPQYTPLHNTCAPRPPFFANLRLRVPGLASRTPLHPRYTTLQNLAFRRQT